MALALTFIIGGLGLTLLSFYFFKKMKEEESKKEEK
jgi:hypothetical protein